MSLQEILQQAQALSIEEQAQLIKALVDMVIPTDKNALPPFDKSVWEQEWIQSAKRQLLEDLPP